MTSETFHGKPFVSEALNFKGWFNDGFFLSAFCSFYLIYTCIISLCSVFDTAAEYKGNNTYEPHWRGMFWLDRFKPSSIWMILAWPMRFRNTYLYFTWISPKVEHINMWDWYQGVPWLQKVRRITFARQWQNMMSGKLMMGCVCAWYPPPWSSSSVTLAV